MANEETPTVASPDFFGHRLMLRLGAALLGALALGLIMAWRDNARRSELEQVVQSSAVGDVHYLRIPDEPPAQPYPAVAMLNGRPLHPVSYKRHQKREAELVPVGRDEAAGINIYQAPIKPRDEGDKDTEPAYFLKLAPGEFLKVHFAAAGE